jgi:hypothetical protein
MELLAMNASLLTADRKTHLKIVLVACLCSLGAFVFAANHAVPHGGRAESAALGERLSARSAPYRAAPYRTSVDAKLVVVSLHGNPM